MSKNACIALVVGSVSIFTICNPVFAQSGLYTPNPGSKERVALMDTIRAAQSSQAQFNVKYLKVFKASASAVAGADLTPSNPKKGSVDETSGGIIFYELVNGRWKIQYISGQDGSSSCSTFALDAEKVISSIAAVGAPQEVMPPQFWSDYYQAKKYALTEEQDMSNCGGYWINF